MRRFNLPTQENSMRPQERELLKRYPLDTVIDCEVTRAEPWGVFVHLVAEPRVRGFIKRQDWSWSRRVVDLANLVRPGRRVEGLVLGVHRDVLRLSRRKARADPFPAFRKEHKVGDAVVGQVQLVAQKNAGILIALDVGVEGFIPRSELPNVVAQKDGFGLLTDDLIAARILRFEDNQVILSVREYLRERDQKYAASQAGNRARFHQHPALGLQLEGLYWNLQLQEIPEPTVHPTVREQIRRILVVEDKESVAESLEEVFRHLGFDCDVADGVDSARQRLAKTTYDLLILDLNLATRSGVELLRELPTDLGLFLIVLTASSARDWVEVLLNKPDLKTHVFQKPTRVESILQWLAERLSGEDTGGERAGAEQAGAEQAGTEQAPQSTDVVPQESTDQPSPMTSPAEAPWFGPGLTSGHGAQIDFALEDLVRATGADSGCLLSYRPGPRFECVAGDFPDLHRQVQQELEVSPVGNVIREGRYLHVEEVARKEAEFRHLLAVVEMGSFAGIPLEYTDRAAYGLFLFGSTPHQLVEVGEERLRRVAREIGTHLANRRLNEVIAQNQGLLLTGFLADSLLHEIRNELQSLDDFSAVQLMLTKRLGELNQSQKASFSKATMEIHQVSRRLGDLVELFRNLAGHAPPREVELNEVLRRLRATLLPFAEEHDVTLDLDFADNVPDLLVSPRLLDQPLLNLMINGIEQMASYGGSARRLRLATAVHPENEKFPVAVHIADTGRGIHALERDRVFDPFFTTKPLGTGLGLYISRLFVERFGGRLELHRSLLFTGSEFIIHIPAEVLVS
jgi:signal transduction histidine kinase/CheY-like chemotaxis protein